ncbi:unnamed protein product [Lupinus luteus]|uniref:Uncharacterized protein n=1 Tax=Lupinus luteus TaxID=3873 RepID=A0AAV1W376_LUPLU
MCSEHSHQKSPEHKRNLELRIEIKRTTSILGAEVYEEWLFGPFRPMVRTSSFHVEDTGSIPVRDGYSFPAAFSDQTSLARSKHKPGTVSHTPKLLKQVLSGAACVLSGGPSTGSTQSQHDQSCSSRCLAEQLDRLASCSLSKTWTSS